MQALLAVGGSLGTLFGGTAAAAAGTTAAATATAASGLSTLGTIVGVIGGISQMGYQASVAKRNAQIMEKNAEDRALAAGKNAQDADMQTQEVLGQITADQAASGFKFNSPSFMRARQKAHMLGRRDAERIVQSGAEDVKNLRQQAADYRAEAKAASNPLNLLAGVMDIGSSMISGASLVKKVKAGQLSTAAQGVQ